MRCKVYKFCSKRKLLEHLIWGNQRYHFRHFTQKPTKNTSYSISQSKYVTISCDLFTFSCLHQKFVKNANWLFVVYSLLLAQRVFNHLSVSACIFDFIIHIFCVSGINCTLEEWRNFLTQTLTGALAAPKHLFPSVKVLKDNRI